MGFRRISLSFKVDIFNSEINISYCASIFEVFFEFANSNKIHLCKC